MDPFLEKSRFELSEMIALIPKMQAAVAHGLATHFEGLQTTDEAHIQERLQALKKAIAILEPKYVFDILFVLSHEGTRLFFNDLKAILAHVNANTLSDRLKKLEKANVVKRTVYPHTRPVRVSYSLTDFGHGIFRLLLPTLVYTAYHDDLTSSRNAKIK